MIRPYYALIACLVALTHSTKLLAFSCQSAELEQRYDSNKHVFLARITKVLDPLETEVTPGNTRALAEFEVVEVLKGNPENITEIVTDEPARNLHWIEPPQAGELRILLTDSDEAVQWWVCFKGYNPEHCTLYFFRKLTGVLEEKTDYCEYVLLHYKMRLKGMEPVSEWLDLGGLRQEWYDAFNEWPEE